LILPPGTWGRLRAAWPVLVALAAAVSLSGCASDEGTGRTAKPYKVVLMPVAGADEIPVRNPEADGEQPLAYAMDPALLEQRIRDAILASRLFSHVDPWDGGESLSGDERLEAAAEFARSEAADLILRVSVNSAGITDLGANGRKYWSTFTWFMIPAPIWLVDDRTYETDLEVRAELFLVDDLLRPAATASARPGQQELDLWDRATFDTWVFIMPPPFIEGDLDVVSATLTERAVAEVVEQLVAELDQLNIPARFDLTATVEGRTLRVGVVTRRHLRHLEVLVNGEVLSDASWREEDTAGIHVARKSGTERMVYEATVELPPTTGRTELRVFAEDEAGNREVRTLVIGDER